MEAAASAGSIEYKEQGSRCHEPPRMEEIRKCRNILKLWFRSVQQEQIITTKEEEKKNKNKTKQEKKGKKKRKRERQK